jgi:phage/plasmid-like protein (TIGR03299 family)
MENYNLVMDEIQPVVLKREATWSRIGTDVRSATTIEDVLKSANLDYAVSTSKIIVDNTGEAISDKCATITNDGRYLGIVGKDYHICQNIDAFDFINGISNNLTFVKAGETHTGMVYVIAELPSIEVFGDDITPNIILQNSHNGFYSLKTTIVPLRIACQNQFANAFKEIPSTISILHSRSMADKMVEASKLLKNVNNYMSEFKAIAESMYNEKLTRKQVTDIIEGFFQKAKLAANTERQKNTVETQIATLKAAYDSDDNQNLKGTMFGLVNAYADYLTHYYKSQRYADGKFLSATFDNNCMQNFIAYSRAAA